MSSWSEILQSVAGENGTIDLAKLELLREKTVNDLASERGRNVVVYYSGWLQKGGANIAASINDDDMNGFMNAVHGLDRSKGLDLVLHTPGGDVAATEAIIQYLSDCFDHDIVAFVPQLAMSGGTMLACMSKQIVMGRQSSIGPTDPQLNGLPAGGVVEEFKKAVSGAQADPASVQIWSQIIRQYTPTFLGECQKAVDVSRKIVQTSLRNGMFADDQGRSGTNKARRIANWLGTHSTSGTHARHISAKQAREHGLKVVNLEADNTVQDIVLTLHHIYMLTFTATPAIKIIESSNGSPWITMVAHPNQQIHS